MRRISVFTILLAAAVLNAQRKEPVASPAAVERPRETSPGVLARLARPTPYSLGALTLMESRVLATRGRLPRIGVRRTLPAASQVGKWETLADGTAVWRLAIHSPDAAGIRIQFGDFAVGSGKVWIYSDADTTQVEGPYTGRGTFDNGEFWSGTTWGDTAVVEYQPDSKDRSVPFQIRGLSHRVTARPGLTRFMTPVTTDPAAGCNLDVMCYPDWSDAVKMVSEINFLTEEGGQQFEAACTASLVGTRDNSLKPYLLTAGHCVHNEPDARTLETFWTYQTSQCSGAVPSLKGSTTSQVGADYLLSGSMTTGDYSLLLLKNVPGGVLYSGWDPVAIAPGSNVVGVHHPMGSWKRILFGHRSGDQVVQVGNDTLPSDQFYVVTLDKGIAQPGSSGSPLFSSPGVIAGTLTWGPSEDGAALCASGSFDIGYGRFSIAYPNLMSWLEDLPYSEVLPSSSNVIFSGLNGVIAGGPRQSIFITTQAANPVTFSIRSDSPWIQVSASSLITSASAPAQVTISINPKMLTPAGSYAGTVTILSGAAPPVFVNVHADMKVDTSIVTASGSPNPVKQGSDGFWSYTVQLQESAGVGTQLTRFRIDGRDYTSQISNWFSSTHLAAGGTLEAPLKAQVLSVPATQTIEIWGVDDGSGKNWYREFTVSLAAN